VKKKKAVSQVSLFRFFFFPSPKPERGGLVIAPPFPFFFIGSPSTKGGKGMQRPSFFSFLDSFVGKGLKGTPPGHILFCFLFPSTARTNTSAAAFFFRFPLWNADGAIRRPPPPPPSFPVSFFFFLRVGGNGLTASSFFFFFPLLFLQKDGDNTSFLFSRFPSPAAKKK